MELHERVLIILNSIGVISSIGLYEDDFRKAEQMCNEFGKLPYFESEMVLDKPWRVYYSWYMDLENRCLDMRFKNASEATVNRIYSDMTEYLDQQPNWNAAALSLFMGKGNREMLLFADQGPAGRFTMVPNVLRDGTLTPTKKSVPLMKMQLKLVRGGKFLIMLDCQIGVATLSSRFGEVPYRAEVASAASEMKFGEIGLPACLQDINKNENVIIE